MIISEVLEIVYSDGEVSVCSSAQEVLDAYEDHGKEMEAIFHCIETVDHGWEDKEILTIDQIAEWAERDKVE